MDLGGSVGTFYIFLERANSISMSLLNRSACVLYVKMVSLQLQKVF